MPPLLFLLTSLFLDCVNSGRAPRKKNMMIMKSNNEQLLHEVEQSIVICQWRTDQLFGEAKGFDLRDTDKSPYFAIT